MNRIARWAFTWCIAALTLCSQNALAQSTRWRLLMVIPGKSPSGNDLLRSRTFKALGYDVRFEAQNQTREELLTVAADSDVCFVSEQCDASAIDTKLKDAAVGIVTDDYWLAKRFGLTSAFSYQRQAGDSIVTLPSHPIMKGWTQNQPLPDLLGTGSIAYSIAGRIAPGAVTLTSYQGNPHWIAVEKSAILADGSRASGRRVLLGETRFERSNDDVKAAYANALLWAANPPSRRYYVRARGSDKNDGRHRNRAFRTVQHAATVAAAGDTVYVGGGTYNAPIEIMHGGYRGHPLRFIADLNGARTGDRGKVVLTIGGKPKKGPGRGKGKKKSGSSVIKTDYCFDTEFHKFEIGGADVVVRFTSGSRLVLRRCKISNGAKQGVLADGAKVTLDRTSLDDCMDGGSVRNKGELHFQNGVISNSRRAALIALDAGCKLTVEQSQFPNNGYGVVWLTESSGSANDCRFDKTKNNALYAFRTTSISLDSCRIINGSSHGVYFIGTKSSQFSMTRCNVSSNKNIGVLAYDGKLTMINCQVSKNNSDGVRGLYGEQTLKHNTIANNRGDGVNGSRQSINFMFNNIIFRNKSAGLRAGGATKNDYNIVFANGRDFHGAKAGANSILADPGFVNPNSDYHLSNTSVAIDAATDRQSALIDFEGMARPQGAASDIGCYESNLSRKVKITTWKEVR